MKVGVPGHLGLPLLAAGVLFCLPPAVCQAEVSNAAAREVRDGRHDFDFELGTFKTHVKRLLKPLSGASEWTEYHGTTTVGKVWGGKANLVELVMDGPAGRFEGLSLRLYNPATGQWSLNFASSRSGALSPPTIGAFENGRGEFYGQETLDGRSIFTRFVISRIGPDSVRFEQSFSADGGKSWELNWIATDTRMPDAAITADPPVAGDLPPSPAKQLDGQNAFDWEFGDWMLNVKRLDKPLTGSTAWTELNGTVSQRKVWNGKANLAEVVADGPNGRVEFLALRLYNPQTKQWSLNFASSRSGTFGVPLFGEFRNGVGEFYGHEPFNDRAILVRFTFSSMTSRSGRSEQAFSNDGGRTWETNWINTYTKIEKSPARASERPMQLPSKATARGPRDQL